MAMSAEEVKVQLEQKVEVGFGQDKTDGEPVYIRLHKGGAEIYLTSEQARSVVAEINKRLE